MQPCLKELAELLDHWNDEEGPIQVTETAAEVVVNRLSVCEAKKLVATLQQGSWDFNLEDGGENPIDTKDLKEDYAPFRLVAEKPEDVAGLDRIITNVAFSERLQRGPLTKSLRLARCESAFETMAFRVAPFDDETPFEPKAIEAKPRRAVRESAGMRVVPEDIAPWLLRDSEILPWKDAAFKAWVHLAELNLIRCLADDVEGDILVFRGPPLVRLAVKGDESTAGSEPGFSALEKAAAWVYDNARELEMRHCLLSAEIARSALTDNDAFAVIDRLIGPALESARIAYGLNISQISRDSLRALTDLRKAISDETAKLINTTRGITTSVGAAVFAGLGVVLARLTSGAPSYALVVFACAPIIYVGAVIVTGWKFIKVQRRIRLQWRQRLYAFLPELDYEQMVEGPAKDAEAAFWLASWVGAAISVVALVGVVCFVWPGYTHTQTTPSAISLPKIAIQPIAPVPSLPPTTTGSASVKTSPP